MSNKTLSYYAIGILLLVLCIGVVSAEPPKCILLVKPTSGEAPLTVMASEESLDETIVDWKFNFGDGTIVTKSGKVEHTYIESGEYTVELGVLNDKGEESKDTAVVTVTAPVSGESPVDLIIHTGSTTITDRLVYATDPALRSQIIAEEMHTALVNAMPTPKGDEPATIEYTDELGQNIIIKKVDLVTDDAKVGYWVAATRNGEEVHTHSPIWVVNSPFEVVDSESFNSRTNERTVILREDPLAAVELVLSGYVSRQPLGKAEGDDVLIVYTSGTEDGSIRRYVNLGATFASIRNGAGTGVYTTDAGTYNIVNLYAHATTADKYTFFYRGYFEYNISALGSACTGSCTVDSAIIGLYGHTTTTTDLGSPTIGITGFTPATNGTAVKEDYNTYGNTRYATDIAIGSWATGGYNNYTLNSAGLTAISASKSAYLNIMSRHSWDIDNDTTGLTWSGGKESRIYFQAQEHGGTGIPFIEITYTPAAGGDTTPPPSITNLANSTTCNSINWTWTNPGGDQNETVIWKDGVLLHNVTNTTTYDLWTGLTGSTNYNFSSKTKDIAGNLNETFQNQSATTGAPAPVASFTIQKPLYRIPGVMQVNDTSTNTPTGWNWSWGDGTWTNGTTRNATHQYTKRGMFSVLLVDSNTCGSNTTPSATSVRVVGYENTW
jgi:PKD repeat protein